MTDKNWQLISWDKQTFLFNKKTLHFLEVAPDVLNNTNNRKYLFQQLEVLTQEIPTVKKSNTHKNIILSLNVIQSCNLSCSYCFANQGDYGKPSKMSLSVAIRALSYFLNITEQLHVNFFGGEPLLNFSLIKKVIDWSEEKKII